MTREFGSGILLVQVEIAFRWTDSSGDDSHERMPTGHVFVNYVCFEFRSNFQS